MPSPVLGGRHIEMSQEGKTLVLTKLAFQWGEIDNNDNGQNMCILESGKC